MKLHWAVFLVASLALVCGAEEHATLGSYAGEVTASRLQLRSGPSDQYQPVATLNNEQQEVVDLWSEGFTYREISRITDRNENTIRVQVHRALKQIRQHPMVLQLLADTTDLAVES